MPEATPTDTAQVTDSQRYQFLRDSTHPAQLQYLRTHCESQSEFDSAIDSLMQRYAESRNRLNGKRAA